MMRLLLAIILTFNNSLVLKDNAWYCKDVQSLKRLNDYIVAAHTTNIQHMSQAGLFKANVGTKSIDGHIIYDECSPFTLVEFRFNNGNTTYYTNAFEVEPITEIYQASLDTPVNTMLHSAT
jgi:putative heme iron utilization protein